MTDELILNEEVLDQFNDAIPQEEETGRRTIKMQQKVDYEMFANKRWRKAIGFKIPPYVRETPKIGRNESCICGSGKKYKKCCL